jgi:hypothetical protein
MNQSMNCSCAVAMTGLGSHTAETARDKSSYPRPARTPRSQLRDLCGAKLASQLLARAPAGVLRRARAVRDTVMPDPTAS